MQSLIKRIYYYFFLSSKEKPPHDKGTHLGYACIIGALLVLPFLFSFHNSKGLSILNFKMPPLCATKAFFHVECPGCGLTRSFVKITQGDLIDAFNFNRVSILLYLYFLFLFAYHVYCLKILKDNIPEKLIYINRFLSFIMISLLVFNWILGIFIGSNGGLPK